MSLRIFRGLFSRNPRRRRRARQRFALLSLAALGLLTAAVMLSAWSSNIVLGENRVARFDGDVPDATLPDLEDRRLQLGALAPLRGRNQDDDDDLARQLASIETSAGNAEGDGHGRSHGIDGLSLTPGNGDFPNNGQGPNNGLSPPILTGLGGPHYPFTGNGTGNGNNGNGNGPGGNGNGNGPGGNGNGHGPGGNANGPGGNGNGPGGNGNGPGGGDKDNDHGKGDGPGKGPSDTLCVGDGCVPTPTIETCSADLCPPGPNDPQFAPLGPTTDAVPEPSALGLMAAALLLLGAMRGRSRRVPALRRA